MATNMNPVILVPTDFSEVCENASRQAAQVAAHLDYKLVLLHVIDKNTRTYLKEEGLEEKAIEEKLQKAAATLVADHEIEVEYIGKEGDIFTSIPDEAKDLGASMIFLGTHGKSGMQKLTGSFAMKVITAAPCPTVVVQKREFMGGYKNIILPITSEAGPWEKTQWAVFIAKTFGSKIHILLPHAAEKNVMESGETIASYFEKNNVKHELVIGEKTNFTKEVIDYASAKNSDMIMIMTKPDKNFAAFLMGSYDEEILFNTPQIPVMCINPRKFNYEILGL
ncbi:MAG: universal stress protein [Bacteroidales bacterium]|nr:universal stress protein [Bacteroidales bacterium]